MTYANYVAAATILIGTTSTTSLIREGANMRIRGAMLLLLLRCWFQGAREECFRPRRGIYPPTRQQAVKQEAAQTGLKLMQSLVMTENFQGLGFSSLDQVKNAQLAIR